MDGGLTRWALESLTSLLKGQWRRRQPLFQQAARVLEAFEAHDVPPWQLPRLLPDAIRLKPQDFTSAETLAAQLRLEHLDWASETLALRREWLDLQGEQPHQLVQIYKQPGALYHWMQGRASVRDSRPGSIHVLTEDVFDDPGRAAGRFAVIYEESFADLDEKQISRYWYLSAGAHFGHSPCTVDLLGILAIAEHFLLLPVGHVVPSVVLSDIEDGTLGLIPRVLKRRRGWSPQNWIPVGYEEANCQSDRHRLLWEGTRDKLRAADLGHVLTLDRFLLPETAVGQ